MFAAGLIVVEGGSFFLRRILGCAVRSPVIWRRSSAAAGVYVSALLEHRSVIAFPRPGFQPAVDSAGRCGLFRLLAILTIEDALVACGFSAASWTGAGSPSSGSIRLAGGVLAAGVRSRALVPRSDAGLADARRGAPAAVMQAPGGGAGRSQALRRPRRLLAASMGCLGALKIWESSSLTVVRSCAGISPAVGIAGVACLRRRSGAREATSAWTAPTGAGGRSAPERCSDVEAAGLLSSGSSGPRRSTSTVAQVPGPVRAQLAFECVLLAGWARCRHGGAYRCRALRRHAGAVRAARDVPPLDLMPTFPFLRLRRRSLVTRRLFLVVAGVQVGRSRSPCR
jgi:hypothetical protein